MQVDEEELRLYYSRLTDEALLAIQRDDLIHAAKTHYDAEIRKRGLKLPVKLNETDSNELLSADEITTPEGPQASAVFFKSLAEAEVACGLVQSAGIPCQVDKPLYRRSGFYTHPRGFAVIVSERDVLSAREILSSANLEDSDSSEDNPL